MKCNGYNTKNWTQKIFIKTKDVYMNMTYLGFLAQRLWMKPTMAKQQYCKSTLKIMKAEVQDATDVWCNKVYGATYNIDITFVAELSE